MGSYVTNNAHVETVKVQQIYPAPHTLGGVFLHHKEVTWQTYFQIIYPVIATEGRKVVYAPLTMMFGALSDKNPVASSVSTARPASPPSHATLARGYEEVIPRAPHQLICRTDKQHFSYDWQAHRRTECTV